MTYSFSPSITVTSEGACKGLLFKLLPLKSPLPSFTKSLTDFTNAFKSFHNSIPVRLTNNSNSELETQGVGISKQQNGQTVQDTSAG